MGKIPARALAVMFWGMIMLQAASPARAQAEQGKQIFAEKCAPCHGSDGRGNGPTASLFNPPPSDFTAPGFWQGDVNQKITNSIENGKGVMPAVDLSSSQIKAVIDYMKHTFK